MMYYIAIAFSVLSNVLYGDLNCDRVEFTMHNISITEAAGVCQLTETGGSMMYICESSTDMKQTIYSNPNCRGNPDSSLDIAQVFNLEGITEYSITCCTGNQCQFGNTTVFEIVDGDCSDDTSSMSFVTNQIAVIGSCLGAGFTSAEYTQCSNGKLEAQMYFNGDCSGESLATKTVSNGDCNNTEGVKYEISCGYAINTCSESIVTPSPTTECVCDIYTAANTSWILPDSNGCTYGCNDCWENICECYDEETCDAWDNIADLVSGLSTIIIALIVAGSVCGLCIIGLIVYCICAGALCCAAASRPKKGVVSFAKMKDDITPDPFNLTETNA